MDLRLSMAPKLMRQLEVKVREMAEQRGRAYGEIHRVFRELTELAGRSKRRRRRGDR